jgi:hypothetical protein
VMRRRSRLAPPHVGGPLGERANARYFRERPWAKAEVPQVG